MVSSSAARPRAFLLGVVSTGAQLLFFQHFLQVFHGNELVIGLLLAAWMVMVGIGSRLPVRHAFRQSNVLLVFGVLNVATVLALIAIKSLRLILTIPFAEDLTFLQITLSALLILPIPGMLLGRLFTLISVQSRQSLSRGPSRIYSYEAVGAAICGLAVTFLHLVLNPFALLSILLALGWPAFYQKRVWLLTGLFFCFALALVSPRLDDRLETVYWKSVNPHFQHVDNLRTQAGSIDLIEYSGERFLYQNGERLTALFPQFGLQQQAATLLTQHPQPEKICLVGSHVGLAAEISHYPQTEIITLENNRRFIRFVQRYRSDFSPALADPRQFLRDETDLDMIIVDVGAPTTIFQNRYFTQQFFQLAQNALDSSGVLVISGIPGGENFMGEHLQKLNATLFQTLGSVFPRVLALPGSETLFFAGPTSSISRDAAVLKTRFDNLGRTLDQFHPSLFNTLYESFRLDRLNAVLQSTPVRSLNRDFQPVCYFYDFLVWQKLTTGSNAWFARLARLPAGAAAAATAVVLLALFAFWNPAHRVLITTAALGWVGIVVNVVLMLVFQMMFGTLYGWLGGMTAAYMLGLAVGAGIGRTLQFPRKPFLQIMLICFAVFLILLWMVLPVLFKFPGVSQMLVLFFLGAAILGATFSVLVGLYGEVDEQGHHGAVYAADLLGGAAGAVLVSGLLIPLYGVQFTLLLCLLLTGYAMLQVSRITLRR